ncbi:MAG: DUF3500 domain-containing protein [Pirellulaceae bacterium]|nr:DUF3500 domain-containing protein [Pirellulaceae bacterium]
MRRILRYSTMLALTTLFSFLAESASAQQTLPTDRAAYVSDVSYWLGTFVPAKTEHTAAEMAASANAFVDSLDASLQKKIRFDLLSDERRQWTNLPAMRRNTAGLRLGELNRQQLELACQLMASLFSTRGYEKMRGIMLADDQLLNQGKPRDGFGTENFFLCLFGTPSPTEPWAFQLDGHHIGVNVSLAGDDITMAPSFIGTQPQTFQLGSRSLRPLTGEIDDSYRFINSLNDEQRIRAVQGKQRGRIMTGPGQDDVTPALKGLSCADLTVQQKTILMRLISQWVNDLPAPSAKQRMQEIENEMPQIRFVWNGEMEAGSDISYRIQGPSIIIEYACQDLGGDPQEHLHTVYRNPRNDYGGQLK